MRMRLRQRQRQRLGWQLGWRPGRRPGGGGGVDGDGGGGTIRGLANASPRHPHTARTTYKPASGVFPQRHRLMLSSSEYGQLQGSLNGRRAKS